MNVIQKGVQVNLDLDKVTIWMTNISNKILKDILNIYKNIQKSKTQDRTKLNIKTMKKQTKKRFYRCWTIPEEPSDHTIE